MASRDTMAMKVCMLDPLFFPYFGGTEKVVLEVGRRLVRDHGYEVQVLTSMIPQAQGRAVELLEGMEVVRTPSVYFERLPAFLPPPFTLSPGINRELRSRCRGADVYHVHNRFWYSPSTYRAVKGHGADLMLTIHNARPRGISKQVDRWGGLFDDTMGRRVFARCDRINCVSGAALESTIPPEHRHKAVVVYNGVDTRRYRPAPADELRERLGLGAAPVVLSNGRLVEQKGFPTLIRAMQAVRQQVQDAQLVVIGRGPLKEELLRLAASLGMGNAVRFVTGIPEEELPLYYNMADVFALPSLYEPSAVVLYEALGCGKPVVATSAGGNPEIVSPECGFIVPPGDAEAMAMRLVEVLTDAGLQRSMGQAARRRAEERFDWDVIARAWDASYRALDDRPN